MATSTVPPDQYLKAMKFLVHKVREETELEGDELIGVRRRQVREWFLNQFSNKDRLSDAD